MLPTVKYFRVLWSHHILWAFYHNFTMLLTYVYVFWSPYDVWSLWSLHALTYIKSPLKVMRKSYFLNVTLKSWRFMVTSKSHIPMSTSLLDFNEVAKRSQHFILTSLILAFILGRQGIQVCPQCYKMAIASHCAYWGQTWMPWRHAWNTIVSLKTNCYAVEHGARLACKHHKKMTC